MKIALTLSALAAIVAWFIFMHGVLVMHFDRMQLIIAMILSGAILAQWLASKKSIIIDFIAALVALFIVVCMLVHFHVI